MPRPFFRCSVLAAALGVAGLSLAGCAGSRLDPGSTDYNLTVERQRNGELLLNIVRASLHRPLAFTVLQTITGTGQAGQSTFDIPIIQNHADMAFSLERKLTGSGQPSFTIGVLDTQEFYRGILTPLSIQTLDLYRRRGLSKPLLLDLFFSSIEVSADDGSPIPFHAEFRNDPWDPEAFADFQTFAHRLLTAGLTVAPVPREEGPPDYILCFQPNQPAALARDTGETSCQAAAQRKGRVGARGFELDLARAAPDLCDQLNRRRIRGAPINCDHQAAIALTFGLRSTYEMIQYAGAALRQGGAGRPLLVTDGDQAAPLFVAQRGKPKDAFVSIRYGEQDYAIPDGDGPDLQPTLQTFQLLTELIALNRSAKDLPAASVTVVSP
ncbi:MAG: hypothetical protein WDN45_11660, partial [Caulobacteraceae bacterium]